MTVLFPSLKIPASTTTPPKQCPLLYTTTANTLLPRPPINTPYTPPPPLPNNAPFPTLPPVSPNTVPSTSRRDPQPRLCHNLSLYYPSLLLLPSVLHYHRKTLQGLTGAINRCARECIFLASSTTTAHGSLVDLDTLVHIVIHIASCRHFPMSRVQNATTAKLHQFDSHGAPTSR